MTHCGRKSPINQERRTIMTIKANLKAGAFLWET